MSDEELYEQVLCGDGQALAHLYDRYSHKVYAIARRLTSDRQVVEEIVQDVFTRVWTTQGYSSKLGAFEHWLGVVAKRIAIDHMRKQMRLQRAGIPVQFEDEPLPDPLLVEDVAERRFVREDLRSALLGLRGEERVVIEMAYFQGYTLSEVATALQMPLGTVKTRLHVGLHRLRASMADWKMEVHG